MQNDPVWQTDSFSEEGRFRREINYMFVQLLRLRRNRNSILAAVGQGKHEGLLRSIKGFDNLMVRLMVRLQYPRSQFVKMRIGGKRVLLNQCVWVRRTKMNRRSLSKILFEGRINRIIRNLIGFKSRLDSLGTFVGPESRGMLLNIMSLLNRKFYLALAQSSRVPHAINKQSSVTADENNQGIKKWRDGNLKTTSQNAGRKISISKTAIRKTSTKKSAISKPKTATSKSEIGKPASKPTINKPANEAAKNKGPIKKAIKKQVLQKVKDKKHLMNQKVVKKEPNQANHMKTSMSDVSDGRVKKEQTKSTLPKKPASENTVIEKMRKRPVGKEGLNRNTVKTKQTDEEIKSKNEKTIPFLANTINKEQSNTKKFAKNPAYMIKEGSHDAQSMTTSSPAKSVKEPSQHKLSNKATTKKEETKGPTLKKAVPKKKSLKKQQPMEESSEQYVDSTIEEFIDQEQNQESNQEQYQQQNEELNRDSRDGRSSYIDGIILN